MTRPAQMPRVLLTGQPGCGKTTVIRRTVALIGVDRCAGFYTEEVRERGRRIGFDVITLDGQRGPLARVGAPGPRVGRYGVNVASFERLALPSLDPTHRDRARGQVLVIDEIGKMELYSEAFVAALRQAFETSRPILGTVMARPHSLVEPLRQRRDVRVARVTTQNRDGLPSELARAFIEYIEAARG